mgnify:CR=1 FL=1
MKLFLKIIICILLLPVLLIAILLLIYAIELALGYYPGYPGWEVGQIAAERGDVNVCQKIIHLPWIGFGPDLSSSRWMCIREYATLRKDPSVCRLMMPSDYGRQCISSAELPDQRWCWMDFQSTGTLLGRGDEEIRADQCLSRHLSKDLSICCSLHDAILIQKASDCSAFSNSSTLVHDQCNEILAMRDRDSSICKNIRSQNLRSSCLLRAHQ